jgi:pyridoxamine 5'-phosphate oxidase
MPLAEQWLQESAAGESRNPWAMSLATAGPNGRPAARMVLLKSLDTASGHVVFYTNFGSRKAAELDATRFAAGVMYWPNSGRQLRFEGAVTRSPESESNKYFASRPRGSQLSAWASEQSRPLPSDGLGQALARYAARFADSETVPRPPGWGGYRIWLDAVEFWVEGQQRFHERVRYERSLEPVSESGYRGGNWRHAYLQP